MGLLKSFHIFYFVSSQPPAETYQGRRKSQRTPDLPPAGYAKRGGSRGHGILTHRVTVPRTQLGYRLGQAE